MIIWQSHSKTSHSFQNNRSIIFWKLSLKIDLTNSCYFFLCMVPVGTVCWNSFLCATFFDHSSARYGIRVPYIDYLALSHSFISLSLPFLPSCFFFVDAASLHLSEHHQRQRLHTQQTDSRKEATKRIEANGRSLARYRLGWLYVSHEKLQSIIIINDVVSIKL